MTINELEEQVTALATKIDAMMRDNQASFQQIHPMLQALTDRQAAQSIPDDSEHDRLEIGEMPLCNDVLHTDELYSEDEFSEEEYPEEEYFEESQLDLSGWSWLPLERETSLSSSNKFRFLFFCAAKGDDTPNNYSFKWYSIDFREDRNSSSLASTVCPRPDCGTILSSVFSNMPRNVPRYFVSVALGTRIYVIGGRTGQGRKSSIHSDVFYFDVVHPEQGWKEGPSMIMARFKPSAVVVDSKIYVFGGVESTAMLYAEVLNPVSDKWEPLPQPTFLLSNFVAPVHALLSDDKKERRLLFQPFDRDALFSYNLDTGSWEIFDECFGHNCYNETSVAVDGVLYCYFYPNVYAYDLLKQKWFSKPVRGLPREDMHPPYHYPVFLFHIGGDRLCLFWSKNSPDGRPLVVAVCTIFTVLKDCTLHSEDPDLTANIESVTRHYGDGHDCEYCIAL